MELPEYYPLLIKVLEKRANNVSFRNRVTVNVYDSAMY